MRQIYQICDDLENKYIKMIDVIQIDRNKKDSAEWIRIRNLQLLERDSGESSFMKIRYFVVGDIPGDSYNY